MPVVQLPSGAMIRGRRIADVPDEPAALLLALADGPTPPWPVRRIRWPDFWVPTDHADAMHALREGLQCAQGGELVEVACRGGRGRTGTAIAAMAVLDGVPPTEAVAWVRANYDPKAVEMPWQARWVRRLV